MTSKMCKRGRNMVTKRGVCTPYRRTILTSVKLCFPFHCVWGRVHWELVAAGYYWRWNKGVSCRVSFQIWGSWIFSRFLLRDGLLSLMNIACLMILAVLYVSLPTMEKCPYWCNVLKCWNDHIWGREPWDVP